MATLRELNKLRGTVPGITIAESFERGSPIIRIGFRSSMEGLGESQIGRTYTEQRQFPKTSDGYKRAIAYFKQLKSTYKNEIAKFSGSRVDKAKELLGDYTNLKKTYSQELVDEIKKLTKQNKYKNFVQVEKALYRKFNKPKYTTVQNVDPRIVFFNPKTKVFTIPREFEIYGGAFGKKKPSETKNAIRQIIGTQFFANSPNYKKEREYLTKFYTDSDFKPTADEINLMRKFTKDFSVARSIGASGAESSIIGRFFRDLNFDFSRKLKDVGKIFNLQEHLKEQIKNPRTSAADKRFFQTELKSLTNDNNTILKRLKEKFPGLFTGQAGQGGSLQLEHRIARSLGDKGPLKLPKDYIARAVRVPGRFNQAKYEAFDKPLLDLLTEYKAASKANKPGIQLQIETLKDNFNKRTGGYLDSLNFKFGNNVKITDSTPLVSKVKGPDLLFDIDKSIKQSNKFFGSFGDERLKGMPKASAASDFVTSGKEYDLFKKLVNTVKRSPDSCRAILDYQTGGISKTCATALETDPVGSAQKLSQLDNTGPLAKVKNAASAFLRSGGFKSFSAAGVVGAVGTGLVKEFRNDDPTTYLSNEDQQKSLLVEMATDPITTEMPRPDILDYQLPLAGAFVAGSTIATAPKTIKASKSRALGVEQKRPGVVKTGFRTLGRGLGLAASPGLLAPLAAMDVAGQISEGDSPLDIATDPLNYLYPAFSESTPKFTRGLPSVVRKAASLGLGKTGLRLLSRAGIVGLGLSLGIQGYNLLNE